MICVYTHLVHDHMQDRHRLTTPCCTTFQNYPSQSQKKHKSPHVSEQKCKHVQTPQKKILKKNSSHVFFFEAVFFRTFTSKLLGWAGPRFE